MPVLTDVCNGKCEAKIKKRECTNIYSPFNLNDMKQRVSIIFVFVVFSQTIFSQAIPADSLYLGQTAPGDVPKIFSLQVTPGFFAAERITISNDGKTIYYSELNGYFNKARVKYYEYTNDRWHGPNHLFEGYFSPLLTPAGDTMFLQKASDNATQVWASIKSGTSWSDPFPFMPHQKLQYLLQKTNNGNYYFSSQYALGGLGKRDWSILVINGTDTTLQSLGIPLCTEGDDVDFSISKNDSVFIFGGKRAGTTNQSDLYVSFKTNGHSWTNPKNLGSTINMNNPADGRWAPCITSDNKYLFYTGGWSSPKIFWVRIDHLIDSLRHTNFIPSTN